MEQAEEDRVSHAREGDIEASEECMEGGVVTIGKEGKLSLLA